jgi:integrase/recombinase XerD
MSSPSGVLVSGPLLVFASGFGEDLARRGYRPGTAAKQLQLMAHMSRWLAGRGLEAGDLTAVRVEEFVAERRASGRCQLVSGKALCPPLDYLHGLGVAPAAEPNGPLTPSELLIDRYSAYLLERRGLCRSSVRNYVNVAREFFADRERMQGALALEELDAAAVSAFVLREARR